MTDNNSDKLEGQAAIELWLSGKDKWNAWSAKNVGVTVSFMGTNFGAIEKMPIGSSPQNGTSPIYFKGYIFTGPVIFNGCDFGNRGVTFEDARFEGKNSSFTGASFGDGTIRFSHATFKSSNVGFSKTSFGNGYLYFTNITISDGYVTFKKANFGKGIKFFTDIEFGKGAVNFHRATFKGDDVRFLKVNFSEGDFYFSLRGSPDVNFRFDDCYFSRGDFYFNRTSFSGNKVSFTRTRFNNGNLFFNSSTFNNTVVNLSSADFKGVVINFEDTELNNKSAISTNARFENCELNFKGVKSADSNIDFQKIWLKDGFVNFRKATFDRSSVCLDSSRFTDCNIDFGDVQFNQCYTINFSGISVKGMSSFEESLFDSNTINFSKASFEGPVSFLDTTFSSIPNFTLTKFTNHIVTSDMNITFPKLSKHKKLFSVYPCKTDAVKLRRLKELAASSKDHRLELDFFAEELKAKRFYDTEKLSLIPSYLYQWLSDFGRSMLRPLIGLFFLWAICTGIFYYGVKEHPKAHETSYTGVLSYIVNPAIEDSWMFSMSNLVPFIHWTRETKSMYQEKYFEDTKEMSYFLHLTIILEGVLSIIFLALFSLGIRNRFKI